MIFIRELTDRNIPRRTNPNAKRVLMSWPSTTPICQSYGPPRCFHTLFIFSALCDCQMRSNSISWALSVQLHYLGPVFPMTHIWGLDVEK